MSPRKHEVVAVRGPATQFCIAGRLTPPEDAPGPFGRREHERQAAVFERAVDVVEDVERFTVAQQRRDALLELDVLARDGGQARKGLRSPRTPEHLGEQGGACALCVLVDDRQRRRPDDGRADDHGQLSSPREFAALFLLSKTKSPSSSSINATAAVTCVSVGASGTVQAGRDCSCARRPIRAHRVVPRRGDDRPVRADDRRLVGISH